MQISQERWPPTYATLLACLDFYFCLSCDVPVYVKSCITHSQPKVWFTARRSVAHVHIAHILTFFHIFHPFTCLYSIRSKLPAAAGLAGKSPSVTAKNSGIHPESVLPEIHHWGMMKLAVASCNLTSCLTSEHSNRNIRGVLFPMEPHQRLTHIVG